MVDIMDMEDIFERTLNLWLDKKTSEYLAKNIIKEVADFVEAQQTIACAGCKGKKFKVMKEAWQVL